MPKSSIHVAKRHPVKTALLICGAVFTVIFGDQSTAAENILPPVSESVPIAGTHKNTPPGFSVWQRATDQKINKLERIISNRALVNLLRQIEQLTTEVSQLRGVVEEQTYQLEQLKDKQKKIYLAQDQRFSDLENRPVAAPVQVLPAEIPTTAQASVTATIDYSSAPINQESSISSADEKKEYELAFAFIRETQYDQAITAFKTFLAKHPTSAYSDNSLYWLGEANYAKDRYATALKDFTDLTQRYPRSNKVPGALLKIGFCFYELEQWKQAKQHLNLLINTYPQDTTVSLAKKRLQLIESEGH